MKTRHLALLLSAILATHAFAASFAGRPSIRQIAGSAADGIVLCAPGDPFRPLANEIAAQTGYGLVDQPEAALAGNPVHLIWVAAPDHFSERDLVAYAMQVRDRSSPGTNTCSCCRRAGT